MVPERTWIVDILSLKMKKGYGFPKATARNGKAW
jgi:hypothetical protein